MIATLGCLNKNIQQRKHIHYLQKDPLAYLEDFPRLVLRRLVAEFAILAEEGAVAESQILTSRHQDVTWQFLVCPL